MAAVKLSLSLVVATVSLALLLNVSTSTRAAEEQDWLTTWDDLFNDEKFKGTGEVFDTLKNLEAQLDGVKVDRWDTGKKETIIKLSKIGKMDEKLCLEGHIKYIIDHIKNADHFYPLKRFVLDYGRVFLKRCAVSISNKLDVVEMDSGHKFRVEKFVEKFAEAMQGWNAIDKLSDLKNNPNSLKKYEKGLLDAAKSLLPHTSKQFGAPSILELVEKHLTKPCTAWLDATDKLRREYLMLKEYNSDPAKAEYLIRKALSCKFAVDKRLFMAGALKRW